MNKEMMKELLERAKEIATTEQHQSLVADLELFMNIQEQKENGQDVESKWLEAREKLWSSFEKVTLSYGLSPEMMKDYLEENKHLLSSENQETFNSLNTKKPRNKLKERV